MSDKGAVFVVGLGPGERALMTPQAQAAMAQADAVVGYQGYLRSIADLIADKECVGLELGQETERAELALQLSRQGRRVCVVSSGDPGIYGMASIVLERTESMGDDAPEVIVVPGVSAVQAAASLLGAPLGHDFAVISLSDLLTPWAVIERRLTVAAVGDFVIAILNPCSRKRDWQLRRAWEVLLRRRSPQTPVGVVRQAYRPEQSIERTTLAELPQTAVDMFSTIIVGNSTTRRFADRLVTPRGYELRQAGSVSDRSKPPSVAYAPASPCTGGDILAESFRIIEREVGDHPFSELQWPVVRRMIHASGDVELVRVVCFTHDIVVAAVAALRQGVPVVTDVNMVASGINKKLAQSLGVRVHCFIDDDDVQQRAGDSGQTRSYEAMTKASTEVGSAVYVVGNAPTALAALCAAVRTGRVAPPAVVALPVGFVGVGASKDEALRLPVPVLTVRGRKGGSAMAAAAVNAMLELAAQRGKP